MPADQKELAKHVGSQRITAIKQEYTNEASFSGTFVEASQGQLSQAVLTEDAQTRLLQLLEQLPHGAITYSQAVPGIANVSSKTLHAQLKVTDF